MSFQDILLGTPTWVWVLLAVLVSRGMKAMKGGTAPLSKLGIVPAIFAGWGLLHLLSDHATGWDTALMWVAGGALGVGIGAAIAKRSGLTVDRTLRTVTLPGSAVPLVLILLTFAMKFWIGFELATSAHLGVDSTFVVLNGLVSGVVAGIFAGRFLIYWLALRPEATPMLERL
ncbi:hypothetical protein A9R05_20375 [Burkholderia sp. KK1]|uniref:DUF6622 family protein n=1 Tax=unclassified Caballeronia TaxID=2646786 RepID=UPI0009799438|nr:MULTISPECIES: DUF6622 family protein [unclassified Caballeronia]AQH01214.1 hypothetical protein A9R05_20375 [Burkholderia sp. KK1]MCE4544566.1 hypothetical protein [Caballeronia sp. PC1]MCE4571718.1 hypothetical protein [Caballeronia sp. CLC5]BBP98368.1 hypothetical protein BSFA1_34970 [Burkholderia sp. SFA1]